MWANPLFMASQTPVDSSLILVKVAQARITLAAASDAASASASACSTNQREMSSRGIGRFQFQGRVSSRHDRHSTCEPTISNPLGNRRTSIQEIAVTESWRLLTRPWNWNRPIPHELISRWLVKQQTQRQAQRRRQPLVWYGLTWGTTVTCASYF